MKTNYDVMVIGGGPSGAIAAKTAAEAGLSTLLVEKRPAIGAPVRCAEGIGKELLHQFFPDPDPKWVSIEIDKAHIIAPDGHLLTLNPQHAGAEVGYCLDRKIFDRELVWQAANAGADIMVKTRASAPIMVNGAVCGAKLEYNGIVADVSASVTIAADGVESKFSRWCGIDTTVPLHEIETGAQYLMTNLDIDNHATEFYVGNNVAPGGYVWIFPKGNGAANVGIGVVGDRAAPGARALNYLNKFIDKKFPNGKKIELISGGVSICQPLDCTVADGLLIAGDAARVSDPLTGGGIYNGMYTGKLAAEIAAQALSAGDVSKAKLMPYDEQWRVSYMGKAIARNYVIKEMFIKMSDEELNSLIHSASEIVMEEFNTLQLIKNLIKSNPSLALKFGKTAIKNLIDAF
jgi:digeranylgeranylglycerophospholipid reductase